ncbi:MAG: chorismate synthase [Ignavibacteriae bacterium]|nr:chorismate synthase [Ignavibacteriota bacterium]
MRGNSFGELLVVTTFGESHGEALGAVVDGCPAGVPLSIDDFSRALRRRRPGQSDITTQRDEADTPQILSGVFEGATLGTPIAVLVRNTDARSGDYSRDTYRAGHADSVWEDKFGVRDYRGGGRASGRETIGRVIGGVVASRLLPAATRIVGFSRRIGAIEVPEIPSELTADFVDTFTSRCPDAETDAAIRADLLRCRETGESRGGLAEIWIDNPPAGLGEPVFRKTKAVLASAFASLGAVTGVEFGDGFSDTVLPGSVYHAEGDTRGYSPRAAGIQGGITNGQRIIVRAAIKPVSTVGTTAVTGRHDPCIVPRIIPVLEAMAALALADLYLARRLDRSDE